MYSYKRPIDIICTDQSKVASYILCSNYWQYYSYVGKYDHLDAQSYAAHLLLLANNVTLSFPWSIFIVVWCMP